MRPFAVYFLITEKNWNETIQIDCQDLNENETALAVLGFEMGAYKMGVYKSKQEDQEGKCNVILVSNPR